jgi:hypothetical protein
MHPAHHHLPNELEYVPANSGLDEFDDESIETRPTGPAGRALQGREEPRVFTVFTVVEQYEPCDIDTPLAPDRQIVTGRGSALRVLGRLAMTVVLVAIPSGAPVGTEGLPIPAPAIAPAARTDQALSPSVTPAPPSALVPALVPSEPVPSARERTPRSPARGEAPRARAEAVSPPPLESLREAFASLNGPFMSFEHCEVRLAAADRAVARCQGVQQGSASGGSPPQPRRVEWTLQFDRAAQRWQMVDATAR